jgi:hypothetical protein
MLAYAASSGDIWGNIIEEHHSAYLEQLESARGLLLDACDALIEENPETLYRAKNSPGEASLILKIITLAERRLRKATRDTPSCEKDVQDTFETLLLGADIPYSREAGTVEFGLKMYRPDFTVDTISMAIEIKFCNRNERPKELLAELNDDLRAYSTRWSNILFVIYDTGHIRDVERFIEPFESDQVVVRVVKH